MCADTNGTHVIVTNVDEARRARLLARSGHAPFDAWREHRGFSVPVAVRQLTRTGARIWTLDDDPTAVAIAIPLESHT
jgi:hypothetical protein